MVVQCVTIVSAERKPDLLLNQSYLRCVFPRCQHRTRAAANCSSTTRCALLFLMDLHNMSCSQSVSHGVTPRKSECSRNNDWTKYYQRWNCVAL